VDALTAAVTVDNRLELTADAGFSFSFGHDGDVFRPDTSGTLTALGINTLFTGSSAADMKVKDDVRQDPALLAAATVNRTGDGNNAGRIAGLIDETSDALGGASLLEFYNNIANGVANGGAASQTRMEAAEAVASSLTTQRESVSGVSLDEEAIELLKFERAFQGAARFVTVVDRLTQEMIALAQ